MDQITLRSRQERMVGETRVIPVGRRSWLVPSQTRAGLWHAVEMQEDESLSCSCEAANFAPANVCRHRNMVTDVLDQERQERERDWNETANPTEYQPPAAWPGGKTIDEYMKELFS